MKILFITYDFPYPTTSGGKNRAYHMIKHTASRADIYLYSFVREDYNPDSNEEILKLGVKDIKVSKRKKLKSLKNLTTTLLNNSSIFKTLYFEKSALNEIKEIIQNEKIDIVHFESSYTGFYIGQELKKMGVKQVLGTENIEYILYQDYAKTQNKFYLTPIINFQAKRLMKEELQMIESADMVTTVTQSEADLLQKIANKKCEIVANGIEPELYAYSFRKKLTNNILFVGNFSYFPNVDAVNFFYENVFKKLDKNITLTIVGKHSEEKFKFKDKRIIKKNFVEDLISEYRTSDMLVFPIRIGGGTNFKVLEAMSLGVPIVARPERLEGLNAQPEEHYLSASTGDEYASQIKRLYEDHALREKLTVNARSLIEKDYSWDGIGQELLKIWKKTLS